MKIDLTALALILFSILPLAFSAGRQPLQSPTSDAVLDRVRGDPIHSGQSLFFFPASSRVGLTMSPRNSSRPFCVYNVAHAPGPTPFFFKPLRGGADNVIRVSSPLSIIVDGSLPSFCPNESGWTIQDTTVGENTYGVVVVDGYPRPSILIRTSYFQLEKFEGSSSQNQYKILYCFEYVGVVPFVQCRNVGLNVVGDDTLLMITDDDPTPFEFVTFSFLRQTTESV